MKTIFKYAIAICLLGIMTSCHKEYSEPVSGNGSTGTFADGIEIGLAFPDMSAVSTRAMGADVPDLTDLDIFLFVFDGSSLKQTIHIPREQTDWADIENEGDNAEGQLKNRIKFRAYLPQTKDNAIIHIVALDDTDGSFSSQVDNVGYGLEDFVMPKFAVSGNQDAYWQRIELGCPIIVSVDNTEDSGLEDVIGTEDQVKPQLKLVYLVRNFAKIRLIKDEGINNFTILGWTVVNDLDGGSVAPWYSPAGVSDILYPEFIKKEPDGTIKRDSDGSPYACSYDDLVGQGYPGVSYAGASLRNTLAEVSEKGGANWGTGDRYLYDRKVVSVNPLYILIYGSLLGNPGYYKVALANRDTQTGLVTEYNVLRNIEYTIKITGVTAEGYKTPVEAASGPAFNNISGDVTTRSMTQISDGVDMLYVNFVTYVVTRKDQKVTFMYRFLENILKSGSNEQNEKVIWNANDDPYNTGVGLKSTADDPKAVVTNFTTPADTVDTRTGLKWKRIDLDFIEPTEELREQKFTIYTPPKDYGDGTSSVGLSRTINLVVRLPWDYERVRIYPGEWSDDSKFPDWNPGDTDTDTNGDIFIGANKGDALTLFFELPSGLPESLFPLEFVIESDRQNIENAGAGNAVVQNGESLFKAEGVNDLRIQYIKTVLWSDYAQNGEYSTPSSRIIRARFVTTTNMSDYPANVTSVTSRIRLHNPSFNDVEYRFVREKGHNVTDPSK